jgi:eukaryotic-like serine/threonine-protein kinase
MGRMTSDGRYRRVRRLGRGGAGTVYAAADTLLGRTVALKVVHGAIDPDLLRREAQSLARLQHPAIVVLHDLIDTDDGPALVLEYVEGTDLDAWLTEHGTPGRDAGLALFAQVARAVAYAHALGVLHCDIKPSNILLAVDGEVKLTDFTLAQLLEYGRFHGPRGGSVDYAAPEQLQAGGTVDERTDVYALGILLRRLTGDCDDEAVTVAIERATRPEPAERFASVAEMLKALPVAADVTRLVGAPRGSELTRVLPGRAPRRHGSRSASRLLLGAVSGAVVVAAGFEGWTKFATASPARVTLPNMVATNAPSARLVARSLQLDSHLQRVYSADSPAGTVIAQRPLAGTALPPHGTVTLIVSKGPRPVAVPSVSNLTRTAAVAELQHLHLKVQIQTQDTIFHAAGYVLDQSPAPQVKLLPGATVTITVSTTPWWWVF